MTDIDRLVNTPPHDALTWPLTYWKQRAVAAEARVSELEAALREIIALPVARDPVHIARAALAADRTEEGEA